jgi:hypothetical protein
VDEYWASCEPSRRLSQETRTSADLICERVEWVSSQMRLTPATAKRYLTDDALTALAQEGGLVRR